MADHPSIDDLADAAAGLLDPGRSDRVAEHVAGCATCRQTVAALAQVSRALVADPTPTMPPAVAARVADAVAAGSAHRAAIAVPSPVPARPGSGTAWARSPTAPRTRPGGDGAAAGFNDPPLAGLALSTQDLATGARTLQASRDLDPHRFSDAWSCGRTTTDGRISGLVRARVDGAPALLVHTRDDGTSSVTVVSGCTSRLPSRTASAVLGR